MQVAVIGSNSNSANKNQLDFAYEVGNALINNGHTIVNGGMGGTMEAVAKGGRSSKQFTNDKILAILPTTDQSLGNKYSGVKIVTHLGTGRNRLIILNADVVLAIGGGAGTLNELSIAWELNKPIAAYTEGGGWAKKLAGKSIDSRREEKIIPVKTIGDVLEWLESI